MKNAQKYKISKKKKYNSTYLPTKYLHRYLLLISIKVIHEFIKIWPDDYKYKNLR